MMIFWLYLVEEGEERGKEMKWSADDEEMLNVFGCQLTC